jgi:hypothetical protein
MDLDDRELEPPPTDLERWLDERLRTAPGWSVSLAFHGVVFALLATISLGAGRSDGLPDSGVWISLAPKAGTERLEVLERPRDVVDREALEVDPTITDDATATSELLFPEVDLPDVGHEALTVEGLPCGTPIEVIAGPIAAAAGGTNRAARAASARAASRASGGVGTTGAPGSGQRLEQRRYWSCCGCRCGTTESAVTAGLRWLARHQQDDGGWSCAGFAAECAGSACSGGGAGEYDVGASGLSLLAFLGAGYTHLTRTTYTDPHSKERMAFGKAVKRGLDRLVAQQTADGCVGPKRGHYLYDHSIAALALTEAYGLTNAAVYKGPAQRAVDFLVAAQNPGLGWRYTYRCGDNDTSVTGWAVMALKSAHTSGLTVPGVAFDGARLWLDRVTDAQGAVGYTAPGVFDVFVAGKNEAWRSRPTMTAVGLLSRIYLGADARDPRLAQAAKLLAADLPRWDEAAHEVDSYYWYYAALALFQWKDAPGGKASWDAWNAAMKAALVPSQKLARDGCQDGSWDPAVDRWGFAGGRVSVTALNTMSLEVYYRYQGVFGK